MRRAEGYYWARWSVGGAWSICEVRDGFSEHDPQRFYITGIDDGLDEPKEFGPRLVPPEPTQDPEVERFVAHVRSVYKALRWPRTANGAEALRRTCLATIAEMKNVTVHLTIEGDVVRFETHGGIEGTVTF